eukprot:352987-Chlamydomonas_euryale.AAC.15
MHPPVLHLHALNTAQGSVRRNVPARAPWQASTQPCWQPAGMSASPVRRPHGRTHPERLNTA